MREFHIDDSPEVRTPITSSVLPFPDPPPDAAYYGLAGRIVQAISPHTEADPIALLGSLLAVLGVVAGSGWSMHQGNHQSPNLFVNIVGVTGEGRKGTAFSAISEVMNLVDGDWRNVLVTGLGSGEGLITYLNEKAPDPRALVIEGEFGRLLAAMNREGSTLSPTIRNAFDGVPLGRQVATSKNVTVYDHHVGILGNITDEELRKMLNSVDAANGFANRFLWLASKRSKVIPFTRAIAGILPSEDVQELRDVIDFAQQPLAMSYDEPTKRMWAKWYSDFSSEKRLGMYGAITARGPVYVVRLAMIYAILDQSAVIEPMHLLAAAAVWDYAERSAKYVFGDSTGNRHADMTLDLLRQASPRDWMEVRQQTGARGDDMDDAVNLLTKLGMVRVYSVGRAGGGRRKREIDLIA